MNALRVFRSLTVSVFILLLVLPSPFAKATTSSGGGPFALGVVLGSPTAITGKYDVSSKNAFDLGFSFFSSYGFLVYGDYVWKYPGRFGSRTKFVSQLSPYIGIGAGLYSWRTYSRYGDRPWGWRSDYDSGTGLYARLPLGIEWLPKDPPLGVFVEIAPGIAFLPGMWAVFDVGVGIRYYF